MLVDNNIKEIENKLLQKFNTENSSLNTTEKNKKLFEAYSLAAEEAKNQNQFDLAIYLYQKASLLTYEHNKSNLYLNIISTAYSTNKTQLINKIIDKYANYFESGKSNKESLYEFLFFKTVSSNKLSSEILTKEHNSVLLKSKTYRDLLIEHNNKIYLLRGDFKSVYDSFDKKLIANARIDKKIIFDIVSVMTSKNKSRLLCQSDYDSYPAARDTSYSLKICGILLEYLNKIPISKSKVFELQEILVKFPSKKYLAQVFILLAN